MYAYVDIETTGTDWRRHQVFEAALLVEQGDEEVCRHRWWFGLDGPALSTADPDALRTTRYWEREETPSPLPGAMMTIVRATSNTMLTGICSRFDLSFLDHLVRQHSLVPAWYHQPVDIEQLVAGYLRIEPPWDTFDLSLQIGVDPTEFELHTAMGDVLWSRAMLHAWRHKRCRDPL